LVEETPELLQRSQWVETRRVAAYANMHFLGVVHHPGEITGCEARIEKAVETRLPVKGYAPEHVLDADNPFLIRVPDHFPRAIALRRPPRDNGSEPARLDLLV
jgi:hypothetical protein